MEKLTYRFTLDTHKNGIQRTLQGFQIGDNMSRSFEITLKENGESYDIPLDGVIAVMYSKRPSQTNPSVNSCTIDNNVIRYEVPSTDLTEEGMVQYQLKLISGTIEQVESVLVSPKFEAEVWESEAQDSSAEDTPTYTALEEALIKAQAVYNSRITSFLFNYDIPDYSGDHPLELTVVYGYDDEEEVQITYVTDVFEAATPEIAAEAAALIDISGKMDKANPTGTGALSINRYGIVGEKSVSIGDNNQASGEASAALGYMNAASGDYSFSAGSDCEATGLNSTAIGNSASARATNAVAIGTQVEANYANQIVVGAYNANISNSAFEIGNGSVGSPSNAFRVTKDGKVYASNEIHTLDGSNIVSDGEVIDGNRNVLSNKANKATTLSGYGITDAKITTDQSGDKTVTLGSNSVKVVEFNNPRATGAIELGTGASASSQFGMDSIAIGTNAKANPFNSTAIGHGAKANDAAQVVLGDYNVTDSTSKVIIGGGSADDDRRTLLKFDDSTGDATFCAEVTDGSGNVLSDKANKTPFTRNADGLVPKSGSATTHQYLRSDGVWAKPDDEFVSKKDVTGLDYDYDLLLTGHESGDRVGNALHSTDIYFNAQEKDLHVEKINGVIFDNILPVDTESGNPAVITDAFGGACKSLGLTLNPIQDLHGYTKPWVGGSGKNKLPVTVANLKALNTTGTWSGNVYTRNDVTFTVLTDSGENVIGIRINGTASARAYFRLVPNTFDIPTGTGLSGCPSGGSTETYCIIVYDSNDTQMIGADTGTGFAFDTSVPDTNLYIRVKEGTTVSNLVFYPMLRTSGQSATFEPYTNICPISGRTQSVVTRTGLNMFEPSNPETFDLLGDGSALRYGHSFKGGITYTIVNKSIYAWFYRTPTKDLSDRGTSVTISSGSTVTVNVDSNHLLWVFLTAWDASLASNVAVNPNSDTTFYPYETPTSITRTYGTTIYGGTDDVTGDGAKSAYNLVNLSDLSWSDQGTPNTYQATISDLVVPSNDIVCSHYPTTAATTSAANMPDKSIKTYGLSNLHTVIVKNSDYPTLASFTASLTGVQLAYPTTSPTSIPLTAQNITLLHGDNVLTTDANSIECEHSADIQMYIDKLSQPDSDMIADANIASGKYFAINNNLYISTAAIAQGAKIIPGSNCTPTSLAEALNTINA